MTKVDLINLMKIKGVSKKLAKQTLNHYHEISGISYNQVYYSSKAKKYRNAFGQAYDSYGLYIFYDSTTNSTTPEIKYIGEAAMEPFSKRLSQHFNNSHGGLIYKNNNNLSILLSCEILILYGQNKSKARDTHFDEDFLIGTFRPPLNDR